MYLLGMAMALCCCSTKEENTTSNATGSTNASNVDFLYSFYDFCKEDPGCGAYGFSDYESFGRWSNSDTATIELNLGSVSEATVKLNVDRVVCPESEALEMDVEVNGEHMSHMYTHGNSAIYVNMGKENIGADGSARLRFIFKNAAKPSKYNPENTDPRKLGFAISGVTVYGYGLKK